MKIVIDTHKVESVLLGGVRWYNKRKRNMEIVASNRLKMCFSSLPSV